MPMRTALLGSAALVVAAGVARAADLPVVEAADQYVRICDAFGAGFFYIPGTDTCLKIGGRVRAEMHYVDGDVDVLRGDGTQKNSEFNNWTTRSRGNARFDARTSTGIGLVRTYIDVEATIGPDDYEDYSDSSVELLYSYVEITNDHGKITVGHTDSFFDFYSSDDYGTRIDIDDNTTEQTLFAYTLNGPSGLTGSISIEDPDSAGRRLDGADDYEGLELPDAVGRIKVEQEWGSAQIMGVARHIHDTDGPGGGDGFGWAAAGGFSVNLPVGHDSTFGTEVGYADGALAYITTDPGGVGDFSGPDGSDTNQAFMARGGFLVGFTDTVSAWLDGSFTHAEAGKVDDSYDYWAVVAGAAWQPTPMLSMGPEIGYNNIDGDDPGEDGDIWGVMWRMETSF